MYFRAATLECIRSLRTCVVQLQLRMASARQLRETRRMPIYRSLLVLAGLCAIAPLPVHAADACVVVFSRGLNVSRDNPQVNAMWNTLNNAFGQFVTTEFEKAGRRVVAMPHPVEADDMGVITDRVLKKAGDEGCDTLVSASLYADGQRQRFVSSLRANTVRAVREAGGTRYTVGEETFRKERLDPLARETLDKLVPSELAKELVDAYLAQATK